MSLNKIEKLTPKHERALEKLLVGATDQEAAEAAGVSRSTIVRWRKTNAAFAGALVEARANLTARFNDRLAASSSSAIKALVEVARDPRQPAARVAAAKAIIELGQRAAESENLALRVKRLEGELAKKFKAAQPTAGANAAVEVQDASADTIDSE